MARTNTKGHRASSAVKNLWPIAYDEPDESTRMAADGITALSETKIKILIIGYESDKKKFEKIKTDDHEIM